MTFINPGVSDTKHATGGFWYKVSHFMQAAAADLNIDLEVLYAERKHTRLTRLAREVSSRDKKPDYLIIVNEMKQGAPQLVEAVQAKIKTLMILNTLVNETDIAQFGTPREVYQEWIGSLVPDNHLAGYKVATSIINRLLEQKNPSDSAKLQMIGLTGDFATPAALSRNEGLKQAIKENEQLVELKQLLVCNWSRKVASHKTQRILHRYPDISGIWSANDPIALGAMSAAKRLHRQPGKDIFFAGLNWDQPALRAIQRGELVSSMGGHFMTGGWALVLLHDYHHGKDFAQPGAALKMPIFDEINASNVDSYLEMFGDQDWQKIDFTRFSKVYHPELKNYEFSLKGILKTLPTKS